MKTQTTPSEIMHRISTIEREIILISMRLAFYPPSSVEFKELHSAKSSKQEELKNLYSSYWLLEKTPM
jgi:hypothetical protein